MSKVFILDFDGVLVDNYELAYSIANRLIPGITDEQFKNIFEGSILKFKWQPEVREKFYEEYVSKMSEVDLREGVRDVLVAMLAKGKIHIVSNSTAPVVEGVLDRSDARFMVKSISCMEDGVNKMDRVRKIIDDGFYRKEDVLFITDTAGDIKELKDADVTTIGLTDGYHERERLEEAVPDHIIDSFDELKRFI